MSDTPSFAEFLRRVRAGDEQAAVDLIRRYESAVRVAVRLQLTDPALYRVVDSMDICQSVMASFFVRAAAGDFDLDGPEQLLKLLVAMARNKALHYARRQQAQRRGYGRTVEAGDGELEAVENGPEPARLVAGKDLLAQVRGRLTDEERRLADLRAEGMSWPEVAAAAGGSAEGRRKQLTRALDRVGAELGLDDL
jgi:RNA polymerase sigma-70 factor (ECF subfamily)